MCQYQTLSHFNMTVKTPAISNIEIAGVNIYYVLWFFRFTLSDYIAVLIEYRQLIQDDYIISTDCISFA